MHQLELFTASRLPCRPYCVNQLPGKLEIKALALALSYRHIQVNPPTAINWIVIDIDEPVISDPISRQMRAIFNGSVPTPNFLAVNPQNGRAHAYYALSRPVAKGDFGTVKAMRFVAAIESALIFALGGDPSYAGLIAKNPVHKDWRLIDLRPHPYTLHELEDGLDLSGPDKSAQREQAKNEGCAGRNVTVFDRLRFHAYQHINMYKSDADYTTWKRYLTARADEYNDSVPQLAANEVRHLVQSVAKWTWTRYTGQLSDAAFSELQAFRGARGGRISAKVRAESAALQGVTLADKMAGVRAKKSNQGKPWEALGIGRSQYYRDLKSTNKN